MATNATPDEICGLFRRARMLADAFKSCMFGWGLRCLKSHLPAPHQDDSNDTEARQDANGMLTRDNVYGGTVATMHNAAVSPKRAVLQP